jgi:outer membrane protein assembly factor BamB
MLSLGFLLLSGAVLNAADRAGQQPERALAQQILDATGVKGGLVVHLGCGDGRLTAALRQNDRYLVQGLDCDPENVQQARKHLQSLGVYGQVTADRLSGTRLPYVDNLVNLVVAEDLGEVPMSEVTRVLCPHGVAYIQQDGTWKKTVKPRPGEIDEWTHCLHDPTNNPVAHDTVGPPRRLQWVGSPRWSRHHDNMSSVSAVVSSGGRVFTIFDEGSRSSIFLPSKWKLIARDAFSGCVLWKRPIPEWHVRLWPLKSGPAQLARRLVAVGDTVYATLDLDAPLSALDAATGETIRTYEGTQATEEILFSDDVLFLVVRPEGVESAMHRQDYETLGAVRSHRREWRWEEEAPRLIVALRAQTGDVLWRARTPVAQATLAVDDQSAYFYDGERVVCLDRRSGQARWQSEPVPSRRLNHTGYTPNLLVYRDVVLFAGGDRTMTALGAGTGQKLWSAEHHRGGHNSPEDLLVVGGLVWSAAIAGGGDSGVWTGRDPKTGEVKNEFLPDVDTYWFHHRCYRAKATDNYLLPSRTGIEFVDFNKQTWEIHHWVRGACLYGIMPCNGLIYAPQHPCACYPEAKLDGFNALAPASKGPRIPNDAAAEERFERGPAYTSLATDQSPLATPSDWPTYRHDASRSGRTQANVPTELQQAWKTELGGKLSSVVIADGRLFVASVDTHTVHALDANNGKQLWSYTAGGRVDSPPTIYQDMALFGSADGYVYCLRASDGELVWRFRAAPMDERLVAFEQVESVWPVHGSVLIRDDVLYFAAGRNLFLDGGVWLYRLDPKSGKVLSVTHMDDRHPESGENLQVNVQILNMPVAKPDILSSDGKRVYMKSQVFDLAGNRQALGPHSGEPPVQGWVQRGDEAHLFCPSGFVDDAFWHRTYWVYGRSFAGGHAGYWQAGKFTPSGRILVVDESNVYGYGREPQYYRWTTPIEYHLWAADKQAPEVPRPQGRRGSSRPAAGAARVSVDNSPSLDPTGKPVAVGAWVKAEKPGGVILARGGSRLGYALFLKEGKPCFAVRNENKLGTACAEQKVPDGWVHLAGVLTADKELRVYVNGELAGSAKAPALIAQDPSNAMEIGEDASSAVGDYSVPFSFTGMIDEVRVYYGTVEADEIARHSAAPGQESAAERVAGTRRVPSTPRRGPSAVKDARLVLSMSFDGGDAKDESGRGNHGRIEGAKPVEGKSGKALAFAPPPGAPDKAPAKKPPSAKQAKKQAAKPASKKRPASTPSGFHVAHHWSQELPLVVRAMVQAGDTLIIAGPPDILDEEEAAEKLGTAEIQAQLAEQDSALMGQRGALLWAVSTEDGAKLGELSLDTPPAWDGMAAAGGRLYMAMTDGSVRCFAGR